MAAAADIVKKAQNSLAAIEAEVEVCIRYTKVEYNI